MLLRPLYSVAHRYPRTQSLLSIPSTRQDFRRLFEQPVSSVSVSPSPFLPVFSLCLPPTFFFSPLFISRFHLGISVDARDLNTRLWDSGVLLRTISSAADPHRRIYHLTLPLRMCASIYLLASASCVISRLIVCGFQQPHHELKHSCSQ